MFFPQTITHLCFWKKVFEKIPLISLLYWERWRSETGEVHNKLALNTMNANFKEKPYQRQKGQNCLRSWFYLDNSKTDIGQDPDRFTTLFLYLWLDPLNRKCVETLEPNTMLS